MDTKLWVYFVLHSLHPYIYTLKYGIEECIDLYFHVSGSSLGWKIHSYDWILFMGFFNPSTQCPASDWAKSVSFCSVLDQLFIKACHILGRCIA
jgi:hypothetical protein